MKPPKFHVGQAVVCISANWPLVYDDGITEKPATLPAVGRVYTVDGNWQGHPPMENKWFVTLAEVLAGNCFYEGNFAPVELLPNEALAELLAETLDPVAA